MADTPQFKNLVDLQRKSCEKFAGNEMFGTRAADGSWSYIKYGEFGDLVNQFRAGLASLGVESGDRVAVIAGRDKGKMGEVLSVDRSADRVVVQGVNMIKRHQRPTQTAEGGIIEKEAPIHVSNVAHLDPSDQQPTRVGFKTLNDGKKVRFAKRSGEVIDG